MTPERRSARPARRSGSSQSDPLSPSEWWPARSAATDGSPPGPASRSRWSTPGSTFASGVRRPANTTALNTQNVANAEDYHGTAVASVVAAPANAIGIVGIYPQAALQLWDATLSGS